MAGYLEATGPIVKAAFDENTAAVHAVVAAPAVATRVPRVLSCHLIAAAAVTVTILAGAVPIHGPVDLGANEGLNLQPSPWGWGPDGAAGAAINIELSDAVQVGGSIAVQHVDQ